MKSMNLRVWHICEKKILRVTKINLLSFTVWTDPPSSHQKNGNSPANLGNHCAVLMQSTGLTDRRGTEIYEGDLVNRYEVWEDRIPLKLEVYWNQKSCGWSLKDATHSMHMSDMCKLEVLGNRYEHAHLLETKG